MFAHLRSVPPDAQSLTGIQSLSLPLQKERRVKEVRIVKIWWISLVVEYVVARDAVPDKHNCLSFDAEGLFVIRQIHHYQRMKQEHNRCGDSKKRILT